MRAPAGDRVAEAPGKLVIVGEYAVLEGAPAVVLAIDRGVGCEVEAGGEGVRIDTPDGDDRFVRPALEGAPPGRYRFRDLRPVELPPVAEAPAGACAVPGLGPTAGVRPKPGFGGSAAACVAACLAAGRPATDAFAIHRAVQGGGSGVDVAASIHGGMGRYLPGGEWRAMEPVEPAVIWSGRPAETGPRVALFRAWPGAAWFAREAEGIVDAFEEDPLAALDEFARLLDLVAREIDLDWLTPAHARIRALARRFGGVAKPSGAGGGDCAVALFRDPDARAAFEAACAAGGLPPIDVRPAPGARVRPR